MGKSGVDRSSSARSSLSTKLNVGRIFHALGANGTVGRRYRESMTGFYVTGHWINERRRKGGPRGPAPLRCRAGLGPVSLAEESGVGAGRCGGRVAGAFPVVDGGTESHPLRRGKAQGLRRDR